MPRPSPALASLLSFILPGLGQAHAGQRRRALLWALPTLAAVAALVALGIAYRDPGYIAGILVQPGSLLAILALDLLFLAYRIAAIVDAYRVAADVGRGRVTTRTLRVGAVAMAALVVVTIALQGSVAWVSWNAYDLVSGVFASGRGVGPEWGDGGASDAEAGAPVVASALPLASAIVGMTSFVPTPEGSAVPGTTNGAGTTSGTGAAGGGGMASGTATTEAGDTGASGAASSAGSGLDAIASPSSAGPSSAGPSITPGDVPYWAMDGRLDVLVLGGDAGPGRDGLRTDSMMLISVDVASGRAAIFGFPRNLVNVPLPPRIAKAFGCRCFPEMLSGYYRWAQSHPDLFAGSKTTRGYRALAELYGYLTGRSIDGVAAADLNGFVKLVDALGGLRIDVPYRIYDRNYPKEDGSGTMVLEIEPGLQTLSGSMALAFARTRHQDSDYGRMSRQQMVLVALRKQMNPCSMLPRLPDLVKVAKDSLWTNIPSAQLPSLLALAQHVDTRRIARFAFTPPAYGEAVTPADVDRIRATIRDAFIGAPPPPDTDGEGFLHC